MPRISLLVYDPDAVRDLKDVEQAFVARSETVDLERWKSRSLLSKTAENSMRLLSDLL